MQHVLSKATKADLRLDPFPYVVIENALPEDLVEQLLAEYPSVETIAAGGELGDNKRFSFSTSQVRPSEGVSDAWKQCIEAHVSQDFLDSFVELFGESIMKYYPDFAERFATPTELKAAVRNLDEPQSNQIALDAQICINTPVVEEPSSVKIAHIDNGKKLFGGLLYLRADDDDSEGGNLEIYRYKDESKKELHGPRLVKKELVEKVETVPYSKNTLVLFLNTMDSLHGVTVRKPTSHPRRFINLIGETHPDLFDTDTFQAQPSFFSRLLARLK